MGLYCELAGLCRLRVVGNLSRILGVLLFATNYIGGRAIPFTRAWCRRRTQKDGNYFGLVGTISNMS